MIDLAPKHPSRSLLSKLTEEETHSTHTRTHLRALVHMYTHARISSQAAALQQCGAVRAGAAPDRKVEIRARAATAPPSAAPCVRPRHLQRSAAICSLELTPAGWRRHGDRVIRARASGAARGGAAAALKRLSGAAASATRRPPRPPHSHVRQLTCVQAFASQCCCCQTLVFPLLF